jgi:ABC-type nitrate/sulfonate/bicarbonate transport system substrate-binding protein/LysM repeat protein
MKRFMNKTTLAGLLGAWLTAALALPAWSADNSAAQPLKKIAIGYSGISPSQAPAWMAYERGFFRKYGLDAELIFIESGSRTVQTLISGDVFAAQVAGTSVIQSNLQGSGVVMIGGFLNTMDYKFMVAHDIVRPDQLKGKTVAVSRVGSSSDFATRYALEKYGLVPDKDVTILQIGSQPARFSALQSGQIQGVMIAVPLTAMATKMGLNTLADLQMLGLEYQHTGLAVSQKTLKAQPEAVRNLLKAFVEGIHFMKTNRKEAIAILAKYIKTNDPDALQEAYESIGLALVPEKPYPTLKGIQIILREMGAKDAAARSARPEQFVDLSIIKELDSSGFIDRLYKTSAVAKSAPRTQPAATSTVAQSAPKAQAPAPSVLAKGSTTEVKTRVATAEEKIQTVARQVPSAPVKTTISPSAANADKAGPQQYTVKAGDTLARIALQYYNAGYKWEKIYAANKEQVKNPDYIFVGMKLIIPPDDKSS